MRKTRIDPAAILSTLKDFQLKTVEYVFRRFYEDDPPAKRFLVADEVGLGKTHIAKGIIAKTAELLHSKKKRIDIIYICSNSVIAAQNLERLRVLGMKEMELPKRLTLLPKQLRGLSSRGINLLSLTPGTSFNFKYQSGLAEERILLYRLLQAEKWLDRKGLRKVLKCGVGSQSWKEQTKGRKRGADRSLASDFQKEVRSDPNLQERVAKVCLHFRSMRKRNPPRDDQRERLGVVGELRHRLARVCVQSLQPDLVILDEFQRFKDLLHGEDLGAELARALFDYPDARILLLSATPYKMLTLDHEQEEDHYSDFLETLGFLFGDSEQVGRIRSDLSEFRRQLLLSNGTGRLREIRASLEAKLKLVMCRTERVAVTADKSAMIGEFCPDAELTVKDLHDAALLDRVAREVGSHDIIEYWKSSPYLLSFLKDYHLRKKFDENLLNPPDGVLESLENGRKLLLKRSQIVRYQNIDPGNARMRSLFSEVLDRDLWKLLWMPASMPYMVPAGPFAKTTSVSKYLIFSSWKLVPDAIAMLCSYEAERRMLGGLRKDLRHEKLHEQVGQLLSFKLEKERGPSGMPNLALLYPSPSLATLVDPLRIALDAAYKGKCSKDDMLSIAEKTLLRRLKRFFPKRIDRTGPSDQRWYWAAPALLDSIKFPGLRRWCLDSSGWRSARKKESEVGFSEHVRLLADLFVQALTPPLGRPPDDLGRVLAILALAGPGVCALRSLLRVDRRLHADDEAALSAAALIAEGFRTLFNQPEAIGLLRGLGKENRYWREVLQYCLDGNIQSVLDEYVHVLQDSIGWNEIGRYEGAIKVATAVAESLSILPSPSIVDLIKLSPKNRQIKIDPYRLRSRFAMRLGTMKDENSGAVLRMDTVRSAFNSPFRPFVLATTSIGQEGLDFHTWCHVVVHWNLPSNPVDLEQREGRVHRYKGYAVRKNIAKRYGLAALRKLWDKRSDPWKCLFDVARSKRPNDASDLIPYWLFECEGGACIERRVPMLPFSRESWQLDRLKKELALYRMVFGQPRQEDLMMYLAQHLADEEISEAMTESKISLSP